MPDSIALYDDANYLPCHATAAVTGKRFVQISGDLEAANGNIQVAPAVAGADVLGVAQYDSDPADAATDGYVTVAAGPGLIMPVTAGGAITAGDSVASDATGQAVRATGGAGATVHAAGVAVNTAASGADCFVQLSRHTITT